MDPRALASVEGQAVTHADEMRRRLDEIRRDPVLSRRLDALRRGEVSAIPLGVRIAQMRRDRIEEIASERNRTGGFRKPVGVL